MRGINARRRVICEAGMCEAQRTTGAAGVVIDVDVDVVDLRAQADASMPASNNNVNYTIYLISNYDVNCDYRFREVQLGERLHNLNSHKNL